LSPKQATGNSDWMKLQRAIGFLWRRHWRINQGEQETSLPFSLKTTAFGLADGVDGANSQRILTSHVFPYKRRRS
jgi:hypothetical protein